MISEEEKLEIRQLFQDSMTGSFLLRTKSKLKLSTYEKDKLDKASKEYTEEIESRKKELEERIKASKSLSEKQNKTEALRGAILSEQRSLNKSVREKYNLMISQVDLDRESLRKTAEASIKKKSQKTEENIQKLVNEMEIANRDKVRELQKEKEDKIEENKRKKEESEKLLMAISSNKNASSDNKKTLGSTLFKKIGDKFLGLGHFFKSISTGLFSAKIIQVGTLVAGKTTGFIGGNAGKGSDNYMGSPDFDSDGKKVKGGKQPKAPSKPGGRLNKFLSLLNPMNVLRGLGTTGALTSGFIKTLGSFVFKIATKFLGIIFGVLAFGKGSYDSYLESEKTTMLGKLFDALKGGLAAVGEFLTFGLLTKEDILNGANDMGDKLKKILPDLSTYFNNTLNALGNIAIDATALLFKSLGFDDLAEKVGKGELNFDFAGYLKEKMSSVASFFTGENSIFNRISNGFTEYLNSFRDYFVGEDGLFPRLKRSLVNLKNSMAENLKTYSFGLLDFTDKNENQKNISKTIAANRNKKSDAEIETLEKNKKNSLDHALSKAANAMIISSEAMSHRSQSSTADNSSVSVTYNNSDSSKSMMSMRQKVY